MRVLHAVAVTLLAAVLGGSLALPAPVAAQDVPDGFADELVLDDIDDPTGLTFLNDGGMLLIGQGGQVRHRAPGATQSADVGSVSGQIGGCNASEQGLLGIAVNPANTFVYLYFTADTGAICANRAVRYPLTLAGNSANPPTIDFANADILIQGLFSRAGNHNGGDLQFGSDGFLYISVGEAAIQRNAQRKDNLQGKILRITEGGGIPPGGNAFTGKDSRTCADGPTNKKRTCKEIFAYGLRNPYRIAFDPNATGAKFFINDVGGGSWEEINRGARGANYGWPGREGPCAQGQNSGKSCRDKPKGVTNPVHAYKHTTGCRSITGGAFVPNNGDWPAAYQGDYLFADFICGNLFRLDGTGQQQRTLFGEFGTISITHLDFSPDGDTLYYLTRANGGELHQIDVAP